MVMTMFRIRGFLSSPVAEKILSIVKDELSKGKIDLKKKFIDTFII